MRKKYKTMLIIVGVLLLLVVAIAVLKIFFFKNGEISKNTTNVISSINAYGYTLDDRDTEYMKTTFNELTKVLEEKPLDEEEYAKLLAKLFIIDFYTLNNKINKYDVGGLEYIYSSKKDEFKNKAMDTMYNDIYDNTYKDRIQNLPEITNVEIISISEEKFEIAEVEYDAYKLELTYTYKEDLGYDTNGTIYIVKNNDKLEIAKYTPGNLES